MIPFYYWVMEVFQEQFMNILKKLKSKKYIFVLEMYLNLKIGKKQTIQKFLIGIKEMN